jgi:hypothetical protein
MKPKPLSLTRRLIVPFMDAMAISLNPSGKNVVWQEGCSQRLPGGRSALDERRLAYVWSEF